MKIAMVGQKGIPCAQGGIERYVEEISTRLVRSGYEVVVYTRSYYTSKDLKEFHGVKLVSLPSLRTKHLDAVTHTFLAVLHALFFEKVHIIHFQNIGPGILSWLPRLLRPKIKVIATFHSADWVQDKWGTVAKYMLRLGAWTMCNFSDQIITVSPSICQYIRKKYHSRLIVISNGAPKNKPLTQKTIIQELSRWDLVPGLYLFTAARLIKDKGIHHLIEAFKGVSSNRHKLVIAGESFYTDEYARYLRQLSANRHDIIFTGQLCGKSLQALFEGAWAFVFPSQVEGLPIALLEALSYGLPSVVSDIKPNLEIVTLDNGSMLAEVFKTGDVAHLQEKLEAIFKFDEFKRAWIKQIATKHIDCYYNWQTTTTKLESVYMS